jgi:hypothetical protein
VQEPAAWGMGAATVSRVPEGRRGGDFIKEPCKGHYHPALPDKTGQPFFKKMRRALFDDWPGAQCSQPIPRNPTRSGRPSGCGWVRRVRRDASAQRDSTIAGTTQRPSDSGLLQTEENARGAVSAVTLPRERARLEKRPLRWLLKKLESTRRRPSPGCQTTRNRAPGIISRVPASEPDAANTPRPGLCVGRFCRRWWRRESAGRDRTTRSW